MECKKTRGDGTKDGRARNWACVVYPESAPANWREILAEKMIPAFVSPLHDKDHNPDGEPKKAHYHTMLMFEGKKSAEQVKAIFESIGGVGCIKLDSMRGYARYLCHLDNPEKYQYNPSDVTSFCGADYQYVIGLALDRYKAIREMMDYCAKNGVTSYAELLTVASVEHDTWFRVLCDSGTYVMTRYLKSLTWTIKEQKLQEQAQALPDPDCSEVDFIEKNEK